MTHRWNEPAAGLRTIHCAVVEVPAMSDPFDPRPNDGFAELVPWADPYIAALIEKLRRTADSDWRGGAPLDELSPPLGSQDSRVDDASRTDWPRSRPGE